MESPFNWDESFSPTMSLPFDWDESFSSIMSPNVDVSHVEVEAAEVEREVDDPQDTPMAMVQCIPKAPTELIPIIEQEFENEEEAYAFYNSYTKWCGFSVRKSQTKRSKSGGICSRVFRCSKEGFRSKKLQKAERKKRERSITRCGCPASLTVKVVPESNRWKVMSFIQQHSHNLESPSKSHCLRSHRRVPESQLEIVEGLHKAGVGVARTLQFMTDEMGGRDQLGFLEVDLRNALRCRRYSKYGGGANQLLKYFQTKFDGESGFFYEIQVDGQNRLTSCFWTDGESKRDYEIFNDVVCFDTTYRRNAYDMPFGPFVGVNHHKQSVLLGAGLLFGETASDFEWLFQTWLHAMGGIAPKAIVTDQDPAIMKAIASVFPRTHHVLCAWHIRKKFTEKLAATYQKYPDFKDVWNKFIFNTQEVEDFERRWPELLGDYGLLDNTWLQHLYGLRSKWVPAFTRQIFLAGMTTTQRSESINSFFNHFVGPKTNLVEFAYAYEAAVDKRREDEREADSRSTYGTPALLTKHAIEQQIATLYTREIFFEFQLELEAAQYYIVKPDPIEGEICRYVIKRIGDITCRRHVTWNVASQFASCSCRYFQWCGIICRHMIAMFRSEDMLTMPEAHVLRRWTKHPKEKLSLVACTATNVQTSALVRRHTAVPKIQFILNELTSNWDIYKIANDGIEKITAAIWEYKQQHMLAECSIEKQWALPFASDNATSQQSNEVEGSANLGIQYETQDGLLGEFINNVDGSGVGGTEIQRGGRDLLPHEMTPSPNLVDPHVVKAKGRPRKRLKSALEKATQRIGRKCGSCKKIVVGHDKRSCPEIAKQMSNGQAL